MKTFLALIASTIVAFTSLAQDTNAPGGGVLGWIAVNHQLIEATNLTLAVSPSYAPGLKNATTGKAQEFGGTLAILYPLNEYALVGTRLDYLAGSLWNPSVGVTLQLPLRWFGRVNVTPLIISGVSMPVSGAGSANGEVGAIYGAGLKATLWSSPRWKVGAFYEAEKWTQFPGIVIHHGGIGASANF